MHVKIPPSYLGLEASQNRKYGATPRIWMTKDGVRIPVKKMSDEHLLRVIRKMRWWATRCKRWLMNATIHMVIYEFKEHLKFVKSVFGDFDEEDSIWDENANIVEEYSKLYNLSNEDFLKRFIPTWPELIKEGQRRGLLDSRGYTRKGRI